MRKLDITYVNRDGHQAGIVVTQYSDEGRYDEEIFIESYDWADREVESVGTIRIEDVGKLRDFLNEILDS